MFDPRRVAASHGIAVESADLGDWGAATLISEYDPAGPTIRINSRAIERYQAARGNRDSCAVQTLIDLAIAHELYHHGEATGTIVRLATPSQREEAAHAYARANVASDAQLDAFVAGGL